VTFRARRGCGGEWQFCAPDPKFRSAGVEVESQSLSRCTYADSGQVERILFYIFGLEPVNSMAAQIPSRHTIRTGKSPVRPLSSFIASTWPWTRALPPTLLFSPYFPACPTFLIAHNGPSIEGLILSECLSQRSAPIIPELRVLRTSESRASIRLQSIGLVALVVGERAFREFTDAACHILAECVLMLQRL
jgi:hypothetical protein